jgi:hypothetical protein
MRILYDRLKKYFQTLGLDLGVAVSEALAERVPLFISVCYSACRAELFGDERLLLFCRRGQNLSPEQIRVHAAILSQHYRLAPLFVFEHGSREFCTILIAAQIPFAIIERQLFIPGSALAITEAGFSKSKAAPPRRFSPLAQVIVLYHLLHSAHGHELPFQLLTDLKINKVYVSRCAREVENAGLAQIFSLGRRKQLLFHYERKKIWDMAQPLLSSPVQRVTRLACLPPSLPLAGVSALSALSNLKDDSIPSYALYGRAAMRHSPGNEREYSGSRVELWKYDPILLCAQSATVDKLSLFLSLEDDVDPRVQSERDAMMESLPW